MGNRKKRDRLELRLTQHQRLQIERAAAISGRSITAFSVSVLVMEAAEVTAHEQDFSMSERAWQALNGILERPARPIDGFAELLERAPTFDA